MAHKICYVPSLNEGMTSSNQKGAVPVSLTTAGCIHCLVGGMSVVRLVLGARVDEEEWHKVGREVFEGG